MPVQKVEIPKFDGSQKAIDEIWDQFRSLFHAQIHEDERLKPAEKMKNLTSLLAGEPAQ